MVRDKLVWLMELKLIYQLIDFTPLTCFYRTKLGMIKTLMINSLKSFD